jgi:hypothetical protein
VFKIDDQLVLSRRLDRQIARLRALEDAVDIVCRAPHLVDWIRTIGDQATSGRPEAKSVDRRQSIAGRQTDNQFAKSRFRHARCHDETAIRFACECCNGALDLLFIEYADIGLNSAPSDCAVAWITPN